MPPPSELAIATKAVERLVKEESFYRAELAKQQGRVLALAAEIEAARGNPAAELDENAEYVLGQEVCPAPCVVLCCTVLPADRKTRAVDETRAVFPPLKKRTAESVATLEEQIALWEADASKAAGAADALEHARAVLLSGQAAVAKESEA